MDVKVLKSFDYAEEAIDWVLNSQIDEIQIETSYSLKSMEIDSIPYGNYHVVLQDETTTKAIPALLIGAARVVGPIIARQIAKQAAKRVIPPAALGYGAYRGVKEVGESAEEKLSDLGENAVNFGKDIVSNPKNALAAAGVAAAGAAAAHAMKKRKKKKHESHNTQDDHNVHNTHKEGR